jgi:hypothetical protein
MTNWEDLKADYPNKLEPTPKDLDHIYATFTDWFISLYQTEQVIFALWDETIYFSYGPGRS